MNKRFYMPPMRVFSALALGYIFIAYSGQAAAWITQIIGLLFVIPSSVLLLVYLFRILKDTPSVFPFMSLGSFAFGIWLMSDPMLFVGLFNYLLSIVLIAAGVQQLMSAWILRSVTSLFRLYFLVPILLILGGIFAFSSDDRNLVTLIVGVFMLFYAVNEFLRWVLVDIHKKEKKPIEGAGAENHDDEYVEIISEDVDDVDSSPVSDVQSEIEK